MKVFVDKQSRKFHYYPFGMVMPERKFQTGSASYRYSINGQEKEIELNENITTALYWEYDARIGRRWNVDPKTIPGISSFSVFNNCPITFIDPSGDTTFLNTIDGRFVDRIDDNLPNQTHYFTQDQLGAVRKKGWNQAAIRGGSLDRKKDISNNVLAEYARSISTAFIGSNTISDMKDIEVEGKDTHEVGFGGYISASREIRLKSFGTKYSRRTSIGWTYNLDLALDEYTRDNPSIKFFLIGHLHPWQSTFYKTPKNQSKNWAIFFTKEPTFYSYNYDERMPDYRPRLINPNNARVFKGENGSRYTVAYKGPHPALIVTKFGYITYGTGKDVYYGGFDFQSSFDDKSFQRVQYNSNYFHKY